MKEIQRSQSDSELVNNENELRNFLEQIFKLDQSTPNRTNAGKCYQKLKSRENEFVGSPVEKGYWNAISLELFHMGQIEAQNEDIEQARKHFVESMEAAKKGISDEWLAYIEGTIHYLDNDRLGLEQVMNRAKSNTHVVQRFLEGLRKRGYPNYKEDY